jgi:hypothetical protein
MQKYEKEKKIFRHMKVQEEKRDILRSQGIEEKNEHMKAHIYKKEKNNSHVSK